MPNPAVKQGWEFAHSLIAHLLISLKSNERLWAICSDRSRANEWIAYCFERIAHWLIFGQITSDSLGKPMSEFPALLGSGKTSGPLSHVQWVGCSLSSDSYFQSFLTQCSPGLWANPLQSPKQATLWAILGHLKLSDPKILFCRCRLHLYELRM